MRVPSARYVSHSRMASWKGISLMSRQFTHLHTAAMPQAVPLLPPLHGSPYLTWLQETQVSTAGKGGGLSFLKKYLKVNWRNSKPSDSR